MLVTALPSPEAIESRLFVEVVIDADHRLVIAVAPLGQPSGLNIIVQQTGDGRSGI